MCMLFVPWLYIVYMVLYDDYHYAKWYFLMTEFDYSAVTLCS